MNAAQPQPLPHGPGQSHDLPPHPHPMMQLQPQMRAPIVPPAPGGPFPPGPQTLLYTQHRPGPPPNGMMMNQSVPRFMTPNGMPPSAMIPSSIQFPGPPNTVRRPMPQAYFPNGPAPSMYRPGQGGKFVAPWRLMGQTFAMRNAVQTPLAPDMTRGPVFTSHSNTGLSREPTGYPSMFSFLWE